jgi:hypothetical protein
VWKYRPTLEVATAATEAATAATEAATAATVCSLFGSIDLHFFAHTQTYLFFLIHIHTYTLAFVSSYTHPHIQ